jgi:hypothetical protein
MGGVLSENFNLDTYMALSTLLLSISLIMTTLETAFTRSRIHTRTDSTTSERKAAPIWISQIIDDSCSANTTYYRRDAADVHGAGRGLRTGQGGDTHDIRVRGAAVQHAVLPVVGTSRLMFCAYSRKRR